jgi:hypothetical protein
MNELEFLKKLSVAAGKEDVPLPDVSRRVLAILRDREEDSYKPLAWVAALSSVAAIPLAVTAFYALETLTNPLLSVSYALRWVML